MRDKTPQQQAIVAEKDRNASVNRNNTNLGISPSVLVSDAAIFMKLGWESTGNFDCF